MALYISGARLLHQPQVLILRDSTLYHPSNSPATLAACTGLQKMPDLSPDISILTTTTLFPNSLQPSHGIFVETRLRRLLADGRVRAHVLAPVPWAPPGLPSPEMRKLRRIPGPEHRNGLTVDHPRYVVVPKIGMNLTPYTLYRAMRRRLRQLLDAGLKVDLIDAHYFYPDGVAAAWLGAGVQSAGGHHRARHRHQPDPGISPARAG